MQPLYYATVPHAVVEAHVGVEQQEIRCVAQAYAEVARCGHALSLVVEDICHAKFFEFIAVRITIE